MPEELYFCQSESHMISNARSLMHGFDDEILDCNAVVLLGWAQCHAVQQIKFPLAN